jgi:hypothetical protein
MKVTAQDFSQMSEEEKEMYIYIVLGFTRSEMARMIAEFEYQEGKSPNAILISHKTLFHFSKIGVKIKKLTFDKKKGSPLKLTIIPMEADEGKFILSEVDPWDARWEHLFFS